MSDRDPGTPQNQNQPYKTPHSGQLAPGEGREVPSGREYDNTPLDEADRLNLIRTPLDTSDLGELTDDELEALRVHRAKRAKSGEHSKARRIIAGVLGGAVLLGGVGYGISKARSGNDGAGPRPVATGPAVAGGTPSTNPSKAPTAGESTPVDPEQRASEAAQSEHDKLVSERKPFYENPITSVSLNGLVVSDRTRQLLTPQIPTNNMLPGSEMFPNSLEVSQLTSNFEQVLALQQELSTAFNDGTIAKAIEQSNKLYGTHYKLEDFYISKNEVPANASGSNKQRASEFLANKVVHATQLFDTIAAATRNAEYAAHADPTSALPSDKFTHMSNMFPAEIATAKGAKDVLGAENADHYTPGTVTPTSARLITNVGGTEATNGLRLEQATNGDTQDVYAPVIGVVADVNETLASQDDNLIINERRVKEQRLTYYMLVPVEVSGQVVDVPVSMGYKVLQTLQ